MHPREALPGNPSQSVWDERALYIDIGTGAGHWQRKDTGIIHQHRCCSPAASTDMAVVRRPKHWKQIRSKQPMGVLAVLFPVKLQGPPFVDAMQSIRRQYRTLLRYQQCPSSLPGHQQCTHTTPHATHHTPPPSLSEAAKHCHLHHPSLHPLMYSVPSTMLRGRGWRSGGLDSPCCAMVLYTPQSRCRIRMYTRTVQDGPAPTPHLLHLIPRQPLVSQLGRDGSPTRVVNDSGQADGNIAIVH